MRNDIHFLAARLPDDIQNSFFQFFRAVSHCGRTVVLSVVDDCSVLFQFSRDPPPIIQYFEVPEENSVYQQQGVLCFADLQAFPALVELIFFCFCAYFAASDAYDFEQHDNICKWNPAESNSQNPLL